MDDRMEGLLARQAEAEKYKRAYETHGVKEACEYVLNQLIEFQDSAKPEEKDFILFTAAGRRALSWSCSYSSSLPRSLRVNFHWNGAATFS